MENVDQSSRSKTVINISRVSKFGGSTDIKNKVKEMSDAGFIIFVCAGNNYSDNCSDSHYASYPGIIPVGAINNENLKIPNSMEIVYKKVIIQVLVNVLKYLHRVL